MGTVFKYTPEQEAIYRQTGRRPRTSKLGKFTGHKNIYKGKTYTEAEALAQKAEELYYEEKMGVKVPQSLYSSIGYKITDIKETPGSPNSSADILRTLRPDSYWALIPKPIEHPHSKQTEILQKQYRGPGYRETTGVHGKYRTPIGSSKQDLRKTQRLIESSMSTKYTQLAEEQKGVKTFKTTRKLAEYGGDISSGIQFISDLLARDIERRPYAYNFPSPAAPTLLRKGSKSIGSVVEFGANVPLGIELLTRRPKQIPTALKLAVSELTYGFGKAAVTDPVQTVLDVVAFSAVLGAGAKVGKTTLKKTGISREPTTVTTKYHALVEAPKRNPRISKTQSRRLYREKIRKERTIAKKGLAEQFYSKRVARTEQPTVTSKATSVDTVIVELTKETPLKFKEFTPEFRPKTPNTPQIPKSLNDFFKSIPKEKPKTTKHFRENIEPQLSTPASTKIPTTRHIPKNIADYYKKPQSEQPKVSKFYEKRAESYQTSQSSRSQLTFLKSIQEKEVVRVKVSPQKIIEKSTKSKGRSRTSKAIRRKYREIMRGRRDRHIRSKNKVSTKQKTIISTAISQISRVKNISSQKQYPTSKPVTASIPASKQTIKQITKQAVAQAQAHITALKSVQQAKTIQKTKTAQRTRSARKARTEPMKPKPIPLAKGKAQKAKPPASRSEKRRVKSAFIRKNPIPTLKDVIGS